MVTGGVRNVFFDQLTGASDRPDSATWAKIGGGVRLMESLSRLGGVVLSSGTTVPGRYESFDLGFSDPPLVLETEGANFTLHALNGRGEVLVAFLGDVLREPCVVISEKSATRLAGHIVRGAAPIDEDLYELHDERKKGIKTVPGSLAESVAALEADHQFLLEGDVFTPDVLETWISLKRSKDIAPVNLRPHPYEFFLYYDA